MLKKKLLLATLAAITLSFAQPVRTNPITTSGLIGRSIGTIFLGWLTYHIFSTAKREFKQNKTASLCWGLAGLLGLGATLAVGSEVTLNSLEIIKSNASKAGLTHAQPVQQVTLAATPIQTTPQVPASTTIAPEVTVSAPAKVGFFKKIFSWSTTPTPVAK